MLWTQGEGSAPLLFRTTKKKDCFDLDRSLPFAELSDWKTANWRGIK